MNLKNEPVDVASVVGGGYKSFWNDRHRYRVLKGGKGSKKSTTTALNLITRLMKYPQSNLLVVRAVFKTHQDSTFAQLQWAQEALHVSHLWENKISPLSMTFRPTGQKILFRGFDDVLKLASTTVAKGFLCWVWIEEAFEIGSESDFEKLDWSIPRAKVPFPLFNQTTLTFNPWSASHWLKKRFFDVPSPLVSTFTTDYRCNEHLTPEYLLAMDELSRRNARKYAVAGLGEWGISEGLIFENWQIGRPEMPKEEAFEWRTFFGLDYGYTNDPTAFVVFDANPRKKMLFVREEFYERKMLNSEIAARIQKMGYAKEVIRADCAEPKSNEELRRLGLRRIRPSVKGRDSILSGIQQIQDYRIFVDPCCKNMIFELSNYCWEQTPHENGKTRACDRNNHLCDALRYAFEDVKFFVPHDPKAAVRPPKTIFGESLAEEMTEGWDC